MAYILVVDDEPDIVKLLARVLEARGHRVGIARDGQEALDSAARERPDVIVLDLNLPKLDGFEVCRRLKSQPSTQSIPIVMMTAAFPTVEEASRGIGLGADEYVVKPFVREVLVHNVERLIAKRGS